jgi:hypothetical protein
MNEPMENQTVDTNKNTREVTLPSGKVAVIEQFKGKHVRLAMRNAGTDTDQYLYHLIAMLTTIEGQPVVMEDLDDMEGRDVMRLMAEFSEANF